jgi:hypothetical protein
MRLTPARVLLNAEEGQVFGLIPQCRRCNARNCCHG